MRPAAHSAGRRSSTSCHSCFPTTGLARDLLARGADPNGVLRERVREHVRALRCRRHQARPRADARAARRRREPRTTASRVYHSTEAESPDCLRILLEHGAETAGTNALAHALDDERLEHVRLLLEHGADPNEGSCVAHAVRRGRGPETIELLVAHGADVDRPGGETWRGDVPLRTPYQHAVLRGKDELAERLAQLGASTELDPADAAVASIARGEQPATPLPEPLDPDAQEVIVLSAQRGKLDLVLDVVGPTSVAWSSAHRRGRCSTTPPGSARSGTRSGCSSVAPIPMALAHFDTPLAWAAHGSRDYGPDGDHVGVAERLVAAGRQIEPTVPRARRRPTRGVASEQEHRVAERVEAVALLDREPVQPPRLLDPGERHHEREQRRARQVEVRQQRVDAAKLEAGRDEERRSAL